jgi:hypothetical protein
MTFKVAFKVTLVAGRCSTGGEGLLLGIGQPIPEPAGP